MSAWTEGRSTIKVWRMVLSIPEVSGIGKGQAELCVAAKSRAAAARLFGCSDAELKNHGGETGNAIQIAYALAAEGIVFYKPLGDYTTDSWKPMGGAVTTSGRLLTAEELVRVEGKVDHVKAVAAAKAAGKSVWQSFQFGSGARLRLTTGISAVVELETGSRLPGSPSPQYKVTVAESVAKSRFASENEAKIAAVVFARQLLNAALTALPTDPTLEE